MNYVEQTGLLCYPKSAVKLTLLISLDDLDTWTRCHKRAFQDRFNCQCRVDNGGRDYIDFFTSERECIDLSWLCDGIRDCSGGEDERDCACSVHEFQCSNCERDDECGDQIALHQCISKTLVGNGKKDCWNWKDEPDARY